MPLLSTLISLSLVAAATIAVMVKEQHIADIGPVDNAIIGHRASTLVIDADDNGAHRRTLRVSSIH